MTEANVNYLRVRRTPDFQNHFNNIPKIESAPNLLNWDEIKTDISSPIENRNKNNIFLNENDMNKENIEREKNENNSISKLNINENNIKNINNDKDIIKKSYDNSCFKINIINNKKKKKKEKIILQILVKKITIIHRVKIYIALIIKTKITQILKITTAKKTK